MHSPQTLVLFRKAAQGWPDDIALSGDMATDYERGRQRFLDLWPLFQSAPQADLFSVANEWLSKDNPRLMACGCEAYRGALREARAHGVEIAVMDLNPGQPEMTPEILEATDKLLSEAKWLNVHVYPATSDATTDKNDIGLRWLPFVNRHPQLRVVCGEFAPITGMVYGTDFETLVKSGDAIWRDVPQFRGAALYTLGSGWQEKFALSSNLAAYQRLAV